MDFKEFKEEQLNKKNLIKYPFMMEINVKYYPERICICFFYFWDKIQKKKLIESCCT